jgi:hypothetical protein
MFLKIVNIILESSSAIPGTSVDTSGKYRSASVTGLVWHVYNYLTMDVQLNSCKILAMTNESYRRRPAIQSNCLNTHSLLRHSFNRTECLISSKSTLVGNILVSMATAVPRHETVITCHQVVSPVGR